MVFALDTEKRYMLFNEAHRTSMKKRYGVDIKEGVSMLDYIGDPDDMNVGSDIFSRVTRGEIVTIESEFGNKSLFRGHTSLHVFPLKATNGAIYGVAVFARNISREMNLQMQNYHYINMMDHIASDLSHKLRKPVATILGLIQLIDSEKQVCDMDQVLTYLKESTNELDYSIRHMTSLLENRPIA